MCGRFTLRHSRQEIARAFVLLAAPELEPRYNVAPSQAVAAIRARLHADLPAEVSASGAASPARQSLARPAAAARELVMLQWGLVPPWAEDPAIGNRLINARAESVDTKPAFRQALRRRRCLVVTDGFYEWRKSGRHKQPYYIGMAGAGLFAMAGLWEHWQHGELAIESCAVITTTANELLASLHDRMPVILDPADYDRWLDPEIDDPALLTPLLRPFPAERMEMAAVSSRVNSPAVEGPDCVAPYRPERNLELFAE